MSRLSYEERQTNLRQGEAKKLVPHYAEKGGCHVGHLVRMDSRSTFALRRWLGWFLPPNQQNRGFHEKAQHHSFRKQKGVGLELANLQSVGCPRLPLLSHRAKPTWSPMRHAFSCPRCATLHTLHRAEDRAPNYIPTRDPLAPSAVR